MNIPHFRKPTRSNILKSLFFVLLLAAIVGAYWLVFAIRNEAKESESADDNTVASTAVENTVTADKVVVFGDSRTGHAIHQQVVNLIYNLDPIAIFHLGDAVEDGNQAAQWQTFNSIESKLIDNYNFYIAAGNHDAESNLYYDNFSLPGNEKWYSVNYEGIHWTVLNSNLDLMPGSPQYA